MACRQEDGGRDERPRADLGEAHAAAGGNHDAPTFGCCPLSGNPFVVIAFAPPAKMVDELRRGQ